jgi:hypothetical protein
VRFEVVGTFWGTLEVMEPASVLNINRTGALLAARSAMPADSAQTIRLAIEGREVLVDGRVRHVRHVPERPGEPEHYLIGVEFVSVPPLLVETIKNLVGPSASASS